MTNDEHTATAPPPAPIGEDTAAIRQTVAEAERYQNDVDRFLALHTADVSIVNIAGRRVLGRETLRQAMKQALDSPLAKVITKTEIEDIRFVRPEVAIVSCVKHVFDERDASVKDGPGASLPATGSLTYVVVKDQHVWRIAAAQTTPIKSS